MNIHPSSKTTSDLHLRQFRTIWISDVHLGTHGCKAAVLLEFLRTHESDFLYLVGDIVDCLRLRSNWYWPQPHNDVLQKLLRKARKGTHIIYVPGNHDQFARAYGGATFGDILILPEAEHVTVTGKRLLIIHGDIFDAAVTHQRWMSRLGAWAYDLCVVLNNQLNVLRNFMGLPYWSLAAFLKCHLKEAAKFINNFEEILANEARSRGYDGVVCGHIHHPAIRNIDGTMYFNDGDWVESCSALVEHFDGSIELLSFAASHSSATKQN
ncbi:UDP-2,3-diacylglucosamine diphosphatase [soil metagenome]